MSNYSIEEIISMITAIRSENANERLHSLANLHVIARVLGPKRTINELIPYTMETTDHDETALKMIAKELAIMLDVVGGPSNVQTLIDALKLICENEDFDVRNAATDSVVQIGKLLTESDFNTKFPSFFRKLIKDKWYPLRCSGVMIICQLYNKISQESKQKFNKYLQRICTDENVIVRRTFCQYISYLIQNQCPFEIISKILTALSKDKAPAVTIEIPPILTFLPSNETQLKIDISKAIMQTKIWQAKSVLVSHIDSIFKGNAPKSFIKDIIQQSSVEKLSAIRASTALQIPYVYSIQCFNSDGFKRLINGLANDIDFNVRKSIAESIGRIKNGPDDLINSTLAALLGDKDLIVKMAALKTVSHTGKAIKPAAKNLTNLIKLSDWRVKKGIALLLPEVAKTTKETKFNRKFLPIVKSLLKDDASEVRNSTVKGLSELTAHFGGKWIKANVIPMISHLFAKHDYLLRETAIIAIVELNLCDRMNDILKKAAKDPVPNVRLVLARTVPSGSNILEQLKADEDPDVVYFATHK
ncbi:ARM repeat-containing protein [Histomonas meleagridis]|uniref:ARM repeat-containing protein n=1 Tax=Histomonas meleagridis TaxID=135588 RepID=UPI00355A2858|nr:ARM repeat-containing protein [Histomonas meleagridis]KAH0802025.1 ARM repeat-containing protein [Histomonas meleagridis]